MPQGPGSGRGPPPGPRRAAAGLPGLPVGAGRLQRGAWVGRRSVPAALARGHARGGRRRGQRQGAGSVGRIERGVQGRGLGARAPRCPPLPLRCWRATNAPASEPRRRCRPRPALRPPPARPSSAAGAAAAAGRAAAGARRGIPDSAGPGRAGPDGAGPGIGLLVLRPGAGVRSVRRQVGAGAGPWLIGQNCSVGRDSRRVAAWGLIHVVHGPETARPGWDIGR